MCPFWQRRQKPGCAATHLQGQIENALFELPGQQKSAGLMVDETNKPAHCFLYIIFSDFCALFALK